MIQPMYCSREYQLTSRRNNLMSSPHPVCVLTVQKLVWPKLMHNVPLQPVSPGVTFHGTLVLVNQCNRISCLQTQSTCYPAICMHKFSCFIWAYWTYNNMKSLHFVLFFVFVLCTNFTPLWSQYTDSIVAPCLYLWSENITLWLICWILICTLCNQQYTTLCTWGSLTWLAIKQGRDLTHIRFDRAIRGNLQHSTATVQGENLWCGTTKYTFWQEFVEVWNTT